MIKKWKSFILNESADTDEIISNVKEMLKELDFQDIESDCQLFTGFDNLIKIRLSKNSNINDLYFDDRFVGQDIVNSFTWDNVKDVIMDIQHYLEDYVRVERKGGSLRDFHFQPVGDKEAEWSNKAIADADSLRIIYKTTMDIWFKEK